MDERRSANSQSKVRKRRTIDMEQKMSIINKYESGQKLTSIAREFGLASSTVKTILKDRERIKGHVKTITSLKSTIITKKRAGAISEMEKLLTAWIKDQVDRNVPLSLVVIQAKARSLFQDLKTQLGDADARFVASNGWFHRFKARANVPDIKLSGDVTNEQVKIAESYPSVLRNMIEVGDYTMRQVYNVGRTELFWGEIPGRSRHLSEETSAGDVMTVLLGCNASGDHKLKPFSLVHPGFLPELEKTDGSVYYRFVPDVRMTGELFEDWFLNCYIPEVEKHCRKNSIPIKSLLVLDDDPCYPTHLNDFYPNVKVVFLPPNSTAVLEPVNQGLISSFKCLYLRQTLEQAARETGKWQNLDEFWKSFCISHAARNVTKAWEEVDEICMRATWRKLCPQFVNNALEKNELCENTILALSSRLGLRLDAGGIGEFLNKCSSEPVNGALPGRVNPKKAEGRSTGAQQFDTMEMTAAFREITSAVARFQKMDPDASRFLRVKNGIEKTLTCYRSILEERKGVNEQLPFDDCAGEENNGLTPTSPQQCTCSDVQDTLIVSVDPEDVMLISLSSESSD